MSDWRPTMLLRFVERETEETIYTLHGATISRTVMTRVLQQQWRKPADFTPHFIVSERYEWRDVPLGVEGE